MPHRLLQRGQWLAGSISALMPARVPLMRKADIQIDLSSVGEGVAVDALVAHLQAKRC
jgi:hypothetical protein